jgi:hypothetical protein
VDAMAVFMMSVNSVSYIARSPRLLAQLREVLRNKHYSLRTEEAYAYLVKFLRFGSVVVARRTGVFRAFLGSSPYGICAK